MSDKAGDCTAATAPATGYTLTVTLGDVISEMGDIIPELNTPCTEGAETKCVTKPDWCDGFYTKLACLFHEGEEAFLWQVEGCYMDSDCTVAE